jgi:hypothetical protein
MRTQDKSRMIVMKIIVKRLVKSVIFISASVSAFYATAHQNVSHADNRAAIYDGTQTGHTMASNVNANVQNTEFKGIAEVRFSRKLTKEHIAAADRKAQQLAVEGWISERHPHHLENYLAVKLEIDTNIEAYILSKTEIDSQTDQSKGTYRIVLRAKLNEAKILSKLLERTAYKSGTTYITFVFVAREIAPNDAENAQIEWQVSTTNEINVAVSSVLANAQYAVIEAGLLEEETDYQLDVNNFIHDYQYGDDLTTQTKSAAIMGLKNLQDPIQYLAIGTLDVNSSKIDNVTGNIIVAVSVTSKVLDVQRRGSTVAAVGPLQYVGMGSTLIMAKNNALVLAANEMATTLVAQLSVKTIR